jgi:RHS repeat-associated protein
VCYGNGTSTVCDYDPLTFRLASLTTLRGKRRLQDMRYTYDPVGNPALVCDHAQQRAFFRNHVVDPATAYTYDALYRLIEATGREHLGQAEGGIRHPVPPSATDTSLAGLPQPGDGAAMARYVERYAYDEAGNLLQMAHRSADQAHGGWTRDYSYDEPSLLEPGRHSNRLTGTGPARATTDPQRFCYDEQGNTVAMPEIPVLSWDHHDRLHATARQAAKGSGAPETTYYVYDTAGQRVRKVTEWAASGRSSSVKSERIYLGAFEVYREYSPSGSVTLARETLHVLDQEHRVALVETRTAGADRGPGQLIRYQLPNYLDSAVLELDQRAQTISYEEYYPYGSTSYQAVRARTETPKRYRYAGKERDTETGLYYHGARYYAPWLGRWTAVDPLRTFDNVPTGKRSGSVSASPYEGVSGNPARFTDPDGLNPISDAWHQAVDGSEIITGWISGKSHEAGDRIVDQDSSAADDLRESGHPWLAGGLKMYGVFDATVTATVLDVAGQTVAAGPNMVLGLQHGGVSIGTGAARIYTADDANDAILGTLEVLAGLGEGAQAALTILPAARPGAPELPPPGEVVPGRVRTRINLAEGPSGRTTPLRENGNPVSAGMKHVREGHTGFRNKQSQFLVAPGKAIGRKSAVKAEPRPIRIGQGTGYVRQVEAPTAVGRTRLSEGGRLTNSTKIITDRAGNVITAYPVQGWQAEFNVQLSASQLQSVHRRIKDKAMHTKHTIHAKHTKH